MRKWIEVVELNKIPVLGSRLIKTRDMDIAVFRASDDSVFAIRDACPHKGGPLSQGIMHGHTVTCPLHNWKIDLSSGNALAPDEGCSNVFAVKVEGGKVFLEIPLTPQPPLPQGARGSKKDDLLLTLSPSPLEGEGLG